MDETEARPFNEKDVRDGNRNYIHRINVADSMVKVRKLMVDTLNTKPSVDWSTLFCDAGDPYLSDPLTSDVYKQGEDRKQNESGYVAEECDRCKESP